ncbi:MAG: tetratricopeptide repeat protein [Candidatus Altiarchaeota archaeon]|nr:tetratricopeptide repeat protein [Candidatus Altiarchaeota archaeon]
MAVKQVDGGPAQTADTTALDDRSKFMKDAHRRAEELKEMLKRGEYQKALEGYGKLDEDARGFKVKFTDATKVGISNNRGYAHYQLGDFDAAQRQYDDALKLDANNVKAKNGVAASMFSKARKIKTDGKDAKSLERDALMLDAEHRMEDLYAAAESSGDTLNNRLKYILYNNYAVVKSNRGKKPEADTWYDKAVASDGKNSLIWTNKAVHHIRNKEYDKAVESCEKGLAIPKGEDTSHKTDLCMAHMEDLKTKLVDVMKKAKAKEPLPDEAAAPEGSGKAPAPKRADAPVDKKADAPADKKADAPAPSPEAGGGTLSPPVGKVDAGKLQQEFLEHVDRVGGSVGNISFTPEEYAAMGVPKDVDIRDGRIFGIDNEKIRIDEERIKRLLFPWMIPEGERGENAAAPTSTPPSERIGRLIVHKVTEPDGTEVKAGDLLTTVSGDEAGQPAYLLAMAVPVKGRENDFHEYGIVLPESAAQRLKDIIGRSVGGVEASFLDVFDRQLDDENVKRIFREKRAQA